MLISALSEVCVQTVDNNVKSITLIILKCMYFTIYFTKKNHIIEKFINGHFLSCSKETFTKTVVIDINATLSRRKVNI